MRSTLALFTFAFVTAAPVAAAEVVAVPQFSSVQLRGGGTVVVRPGSSQRVTLVEGSRAITHFGVDRNGKLTIDICRNNCPREYRMRVEIESPRVPDAAISGGGTITIASGFAPQGNVAAAVSGGGVIDARALRVSSFSAAVNGGGRILAGHSSHLSAAVNGGGQVRYAGNPHVSSVVNGGGTVSRSE